LGPIGEQQERPFGKTLEEKSASQPKLLNISISQNNQRAPEGGAHDVVSSGTRGSRLIQKAQRTKFKKITQKTKKKKNPPKKKTQNRLFFQGEEAKVERRLGGRKR